MIPVYEEKLREMLANLTECSAIFQCAEDAAAVANIPHIQSALSVANGIANSVRADLSLIMEDAPEKEAASQ